MRFIRPKSITRPTFPRVRELFCALLLVLGPPTGADPTLPGCTGGIAPNPSLEEGVDGYAGPVQRGQAHAFDGTHHATVSGLATADLPVVPGGLYDLSVWSGSTKPGPLTATGLQFLDGDGVQVGRTYANWPLTEEPKRHNSYGMIAPPNAATVRFFATADTEIHWDCVFLRVSAYEVELEAEDGTFVITVTNTGSEPLTNITLDLPECTDLDREPFDLKEQVVRTCNGPTSGTVTVTASGALYWNGALPDRSVSLVLGKQPQHTGGR
jgi:hypothetical protein